MPRKPKPKPRQRRPYGGGSISVAADGAIRARTAPDADGRRRSRTFRPGQQAAAEAWLLAVAAPAQPVEAAAPVTLGDWRAFWLDTYVRPFAPPNTVHKYAWALDKLAALDAVPLDQLRPSTIQTAVATLGIAPAGVQAVVGVWRRCLEAAVDDELIARNPARRVAVPRAPKRPPARHVTAEEVAALRAAIVGHRFEAAYALALGCGLRIGEILGLHWEHVDAERGRIWVQWQWTNSHWRDTPKSGAPHWVPMPPFVRSALLRHRRQQPPGAVLVLESPHPRRKTNRDGKPRPWSRETVAAELAQIVASLKLPHLTNHAARHGLSSALLDGGASPAVIAERLGNTPAVVLQAYAHATREGRRLADDLTAAYLGEDGPARVSDAETG